MAHDGSSDYIRGELARAFASWSRSARPEDRARFEARIAAWSRVQAGIDEGTLEIGARTPTGAPPWVTLEVLRGGFASGGYAAEGPLRPHERARLERLGLSAGAEARARLNASYLGAQGLAELDALLDSGHYQVTVPEEAALLTVAWLLRAGHAEEAAALLEAIAGWLGQLRFYPQPAERAVEPSAQVRRQPVRDTVAGLRGAKVPARVAVMNEMLTVWPPMVDRALALVLETVVGDVPALSEDGRTVTGGWPLRTFPAGWAARARALLDEHAALRLRHPLGKKLDRPGETYHALRAALEAALHDPRGFGPAVEPAVLSRTRCVIARVVKKRGLPSSEATRAVRRAERAHAARPLHAELREVLLARLQRFPQDGGLTAPEDLLVPVQESEARADRDRPLVAGTPLPGGFERRVARSLEAPVEVLVERGVLPSPETLAEVTPQLAAFVKASAIGDPALRRLYGQTYVAFRARRSLLLVDLAHQVRLEELPWVQAMERHRGPSHTAEAQARETLRALTRLVLSTFPHVLLPNPLVTDLGTLARLAQLDVPLVEEIAADIFMGTFTDKFLRAAHAAGRLLRGTIYERYYDARYAEVLELSAPSRTAEGAPRQGWADKASSAFGALCTARAHGLRPGGGETPTHRGVAANGRVIEQAQILTTHNLAALYTALELGPALAEQAPALARACFEWVLDRAPIAARAHRHAQLIARKNMAYAWRQMLFFLAIAGDDAHAPFAAWVGERMAAVPADTAARVRPWVLGLAAALGGRPVESEPGAERFLGWVVG